ncbi:MAG: 3'-5' exoribonuclease, partial [Cellulosilyticaceae bacterium]
TLISIGLVSEDGRKFYGECYDYDKEQINTWLQENVINHTTYLSEVSKTDIMSVDLDNMYLVSTKYGLKNYLSTWFEQFDSVELVSDVCHYDMVLLVDLFGTAFDLPENVSPVCHDINQDIARVVGCTSAEAFDKSREELIGNLGVKAIEAEISSTAKHNALYDAYVIRMLYSLLNKTK